MPRHNFPARISYSEKLNAVHSDFLLTAAILAAHMVQFNAIMDAYMYVHFSEWSWRNHLFIVIFMLQLKFQHHIDHHKTNQKLKSIISETVWTSEIWRFGQFSFIIVYDTGMVLAWCCDSCAISNSQWIELINREMFKLWIITKTS